MSPPAVSAPDLRERLLAAALDLIQEGGLKALSIRAVARRADVSHQAPYHYFPDREHVLAAVCEQGFARMRHAFEAVMANATDDPVTRLHRLGEAYLRFAFQHPAHYSLMFRAEVVDHAHHPEVSAAGEGTFSALLDTVTAIRDAGRLRGDDPMAMSLLIWSTVHGAASLWLDGALGAKAPPGFNEDTHVALITGLLTRLVTTDGT